MTPVQITGTIGLVLMVLFIFAVLMDMRERRK